MKSLLIVFLGACLGFFPVSNFSADDSSLSSAPMGSIVMEDDIMLLVDTETSGVTVTSIKVYDSSQTLVLNITTCQSRTCEVDVSALASGDYDVDVETNVWGGGFSGPITILSS